MDMTLHFTTVRSHDGHFVPFSQILILFWIQVTKTVPLNSDPLAALHTDPISPIFRYRRFNPTLYFNTEGVLWIPA